VKHKISRGLAPIAMAGIAAASVLTDWTAVRAATTTQNVNVTNSTSHPVPVAQQGTASVKVTNPVTISGTTSVSGTVSISGTPSVNVANFPSAASEITATLGTGEAVGQINGNQNSVTVLQSLDVSGARTARLYLGCFGSSSCANVEFEVATAVGNTSYELDRFNLGGRSFATKLYDVPGLAITVNAYHTDPSMLIRAGIVGRSH
jgi:hypothetical protein